MSRTANAVSARPSQLDLDEYIERNALLAAREIGQFRPGFLADVMGWHKSNGSRAMAGSPEGGRWFAHVFGGLVRLATHPDVDAYPLIIRMEIVLKRLVYRVRSTASLRASYWKHADRAREADRDIAAALEGHDARARGMAEARRGVAAKNLAACIEELDARGTNPAAEGRPR
jgi:hypothetical protein